jgi:ribulose-phosphate 3-epimerase
VAVRINPSILSADFANLERDLAAIATADFAHVDVMDQHFVPNLTIGLPVVRRLAQVSPVPLDVHLMIEDADRWAPDYAAAGAASVTFHAEATAAPVRLARELRSAGVRAGIALRPATPVEPLLDLLDEFDMVLVMTVEPGFGGQQLLDGTLPKLRRLRAAITAARAATWVQVDGGVGRETIGRIAAAGADTFVAGNAVYTAPDVAAEIAALRALAEPAVPA